MLHLILMRVIGIKLSNQRKKVEESKGCERRGPDGGWKSQRERTELKKLEKPGRLEKEYRGTSLGILSQMASSLPE